MRRVTAVAAPLAHLVGPGKIKVVNSHLAFSAKEQGPVRLDPGTLRLILCYGAVGVSDDAFDMLFLHDIDVAWLSPAGQRYRGRLVRSEPSRTLLRILQHDAVRDAAFRSQIAAGFVQRKIDSQIVAARHYQRHGAEASALLDRLDGLRKTAAGALSLDQLRGVEGMASLAWFRLLGGLLKAPWTFAERSRRPPRDPFNALLSLGYTWLAIRTKARCEAAGLEPYVGFLHDFRPGRPSLACDVLEPYRVPAVDRWALKICNERRWKPDAFVAQENGGFRLHPEIFPTILQAWEESWLEAAMDAALDADVQSLSARLRSREEAAIDSLR